MKNLRHLNSIVESKQSQWLQEYRTSILPQKKQRKHIKTYGTYNVQQIDSLLKFTIKEDALKTLIIDILKVCYLYDPLEMALRQQKQADGLFKVDTILKIFHEGLFYRHIIQRKVNDIQERSLVNNQSTEMNVKVIIAALLANVSKRLTLEDIGACILIFNLEQALHGSRPFGLLLEQAKIIKILEKIERAINAADLRNIIAQIKQQKETIYITLDQFLYLASITTKKKTKNNAIFFLQNMKQDILKVQDSAEIITKRSQEDINKKKGKSMIQGLTYFQGKDQIKQKENLYKHIRKTIYQKNKTKSLVLQQQMQKKSRPQSSVFKKSIEIMRQRSESFKVLQHKIKKKLTNPSFFRNTKEAQKIRRSRKSRYNLVSLMNIKRDI